MPSNKTREIFVNSAREVFARKGVEEATMHDIAVASQKGRRTLYTYFKSKEELYFAVVESELDRLSKRLHEVAHQPIDPDKKIIKLIRTHLDSIKSTVYRNGTLRAAFFRDIWKVEAVRKNFDQTEIEVLQKVLQEGKEQKIFQIDNVGVIAEIIHYCIKGVEVPYIRGNIGEQIDEEKVWIYVKGFVYNALGRKKQHNSLS